MRRWLAVTVGAGLVGLGLMGARGAAWAQGMASLDNPSFPVEPERMGHPAG